MHLGPIKIRPLHLKIHRNIANRIHFSAQDVLNLVSGAKKENRNNQPLKRVSDIIARTSACYIWPSALGIAAKLGSLLSLAFVLVGGRSWLKMSDSPMIKSGIFGELFDFLSVVVCIMYVYLVVVPLLQPKLQY